MEKKKLRYFGVFFVFFFKQYLLQSFYMIFCINLKEILLKVKPQVIWKIIIKSFTLRFKNMLHLKSTY